MITHLKLKMHKSFLLKVIRLTMIKFKGRELQHTNLGKLTMNKIKVDMEKI